MKERVCCLHLVIPSFVFLLAFQDGIVCVWDLDTYTLQRQLEPHLDRISSVAISPDGLRLITCSIDGTLKVTELETGVETMSVGDDAYKCMVSDGAFRIWGGREEGGFEHRLNFVSLPLQGHLRLRATSLGSSSSGASFKGSALPHSQNTKVRHTRLGE